MTMQKGNWPSNGFTLTQPSMTSKLGRIRLAFTTTAILLCGLAVSGLSTGSIAQAQTIDEASVAHPGWVQIPGELIRPDCVHQIPSGATVEVTNDGQATGDVTLNGALVAHYDACPEAPVVTRPRGRTANLASAPGTGNGWVEASEWDVPLSSSDNIDYMGGTWTVPSYPSSDGALIYLFNGIEPASGEWILQPVLQYGVSPDGGGNYWGIASWLVGNNYAFVSPLEPVYPGDSIFGSTGLNNVSGSTLYWKVAAKDETTGAYTWITAHVSNQHWTWAFAGVLEAYNVTSCSQFPSNGRATFNHSLVDHGFPYLDKVPGNGWAGAIYSYGGPRCHFMVVAGSESTLDF
ncbi:MAG: hypothetical protein WCC04_11575 [Terriglobales bacterium]